MSALAFFIGGLIAVTILTTLFSWLLRNLAAPIPRILMSNALSLFVATTLGGFGLANGQGPKFTEAFALYVIPQLVLLILTLLRNNRRSINSEEKAPRQNEYNEPVLGMTSMNLPLQPRVSLSRYKINEGNRKNSTKEQTSRQSNNFVARYWRGEFSLGVSYWVFGFLGGLAVGVIPYVANAIFSADVGYEPSAIFATLAFIWVCILVTTIWQIVGLWRSANRHIQSRSELGLRAPWAGLAKIAVVIGSLNLAVQFIGGGVPQLIETSRMAFMDDPDIPSYSIRIMRNGTEAEITGGFKYGLTKDFTSILSASPQIHVLHLNSLGGRIGEAEKLNKIIRDYNLVTYVSANCMSACTVAFAGGTERWLHKGAVLGFHAPAFPGMSELDLKESTESQKNIFGVAGFAASFVDRALSTPNAEMWMPSSEELYRDKVITATSDGSNFAASGYGGNVPKEEMAAKLAEFLPVLQTLKQRFPNDYAPIINSFYDNYVLGQTESDVIAAARAKLIPLIIANRPFADDEVLIDFGKLLVDQYKVLGAKDPEHCYMYASGEAGTRNFSFEFSADLIQRESMLIDRILSTSARRAPISEEVSNPLWEKVMIQVAGRVGNDKLYLLQEPKPDPSKYADYCNVLIAFFQEVTSLDGEDAAILMRQAMSVE